MPQLRCGPVFVISHYLYQDGNPAGTISFIRTFLNNGSLKFSGALFNSPVYIIFGHIFSLGSQNRCAETRIPVRVSPTNSRSDGYFFYEPGKNLPALGIQRP